jgi:precorrin-2 dehydrogenase/sirohydrochlorin ferrochelatase
VPIDENLYPVNLVLAGRRCVVVGAGRVAARKAEGLRDAGAVVTVVAPRISAEVRGLGVAVQQRTYRRGDLDGAWLAIAATGDPALNQVVRDDGDAAGVWVNAADDPAACSFTLPAVARQGPVMVTVSTSGYSPALATWLKAHVAGELGPEFAVLASLFAEARDRLKSEGRSTEDVDWRPVLDWSMLELVRAGNTAGARERLEACLLSS